MKKYLLISFFVAFTALMVTEAHCQSVHPKVQTLIDGLNSWMSGEMQATGTVDPLLLKAKSEYIRQVQDSLAKAESIALKQLASGGDILESKKTTLTLMAGSSIVVPSNTEWRITGMYVKGDMDSYRVQVNSVKLQEVYIAGEKITAPTLTSESALLSGDSMSASYDIDFIEIKFK